MSRPVHPDNARTDPGAAHAEVTAIGRPRELRPRGLRVRIAPSAPSAFSSNWQDAGFWFRKSWFKSTRGSDAAAHGCGSAFVQRTGV